MRRNRGGYTIIEVMIVLAISGVLFTSAIVVFQGQQSKTILSQSLYDLASKLQGYATEVSSGVYDNSSNYSCNASAGGSAVLSNGGSGNAGCLFLGRAVQIVQNQPTIYTYTVLGSRLDSSGSSIAQFNQANPEPALDSSGNWVLTDQYTLPSGQTFISSKVKDLSGNPLTDAYMVGLYIDLAGATSTGGTTSLSVRGYNLAANAAPQSNAVKNCIEQKAACSAPKSVRTWQICVQQGSTLGSINVDSGPGGVTTRVNAQECA
jgi:prepilin-type N-terminal cleavage/methylation domain-containing protein